MIEYHKNFSLEPLFYINDEGLVCQEEFRDIPNYEGLYQVSDLGRVKSLNYKNTGKEKILISGDNGRGYLSLGLAKNKKRKFFKVYILVAITFLNHKPCGYKLVVDHKDENKLNNCLKNLQIITHRENISKSTKNTSSKYTGVSWEKSRNKWVCFIRIENKRFNLGYFKDEKEASDTYQNALKNWVENKIKPIIKKKYTSKHKGIFFNKKTNKWILNIYLKDSKQRNIKQRIYIGCYNTEEEAFKKLQEIKKTVD